MHVREKKPIQGFGGKSESSKPLGILSVNARVILE
jgi:hypothetical protein